MTESSPVSRPMIVRGRRAHRWLLVGVVVSVAGCSFGDRRAQDPEPCVASGRTTVVEATTLEDAEPTVAFDVVDGRATFVTLLADPDFNAGAGLNGGLLHASVFVIEDGATPRPPSYDDDGARVRSPDDTVARHRSVGESRFLDRPPGRYRLWGQNGPIIEVFTCPATPDS